MLATKSYFAWTIRDRKERWCVDKNEKGNKTREVVLIRTRGSQKVWEGLSESCGVMSTYEE